MAEAKHDNLTVLRKLEEERNQLVQLGVAAGAGSLAMLVLSSFLVVGLMPVFPVLAGKLQAASQRFLLMREIMEGLDAEGEEVEIHAAIETGEGRGIDLFLKFPEKEYILIQIRSIADARIGYDEHREVLKIRRKGKSYPWKETDDPLAKLSWEEQWLRKQRPELFGDLPRDRKRSLAKVLVLWDDTGLADHPEHLYATINDQKYLTIRRRGTTSIVRRTQVVSFIKDYLASRRSQRIPLNS